MIPQGEYVTEQDIVDNVTMTEDGDGDGDGTGEDYSAYRTLRAFLIGCVLALGEWLALAWWILGR